MKIFPISLGLPEDFESIAKKGVGKRLFGIRKFTLFFRTLEATNELPVNVGQLIFIPCIACIWPYSMVSKH